MIALDARNGADETIFPYDQEMYMPRAPRVYAQKAGIRIPLLKHELCGSRGILGGFPGYVVH